MKDAEAVFVNPQATAVNVTVYESLSQLADGISQRISE